jgi:hypothetical protein
MATAEKTENATETKEEKDTAMVAVQVPVEFKTALEEKAKSENMTVAKYMRTIAAREISFDLTSFEARTRTRSSKFASDEEREAAKKAASQKRAETIKALMAKYKAGEITL